MKVRMLTSIAGPLYSYHTKSGPNEDGVIDIEEKEGKRFIQAGIAEIPRDEPKKQTTTKKAPAKAEKTVK